jgi:hypothetical protein
VIEKMLVVLSNAVKVESVPLKSENFPDGTIGWVHIAVVAASAPSHTYPHLAVIRADGGAALRGTSDPQIRLRANAVRDEIHASGGPTHAADAVEDVATGRW